MGRPIFLKGKKKLPTRIKNHYAGSERAVEEYKLQKTNFQLYD